MVLGLGGWSRCSPPRDIESGAGFPPDPVVSETRTGLSDVSGLFFVIDNRMFSVPGFVFCCRLRQLSLPRSTADLLLLSRAMRAISLASSRVLIRRHSS